MDTLTLTLGIFDDERSFSARPDVIVVAKIVVPVLLGIDNIANGKVRLHHL